MQFEDYTLLIQERSGRIHRSLDLVAISQQLRRGATLVIDSIDELYEPIKSLSSEMERLFHEEIQVNAYISWGDIPGFPVHKDPHDVFIFQVMGRKKWHIIVPNNKAFSELENWGIAVTRVAKDTWEFILEQGDALYLPMGWEHEAFPLGEATIHLTAGVERRTGNNYLSWILKESGNLKILQEPIPRFHGEIAQKEYQQQLKEAIVQTIDSLPIERYFEACDSVLRLRKHINLPWSATGLFSIESDNIINWLPLFINSKIQESNIYLVEAGGKTLEIKAPLFPIVEHLELVHQILYENLCSFAANYKIMKIEVDELLDRLSIFGWIAVTKTGNPD